jgi:hydrogenase nickel incorporation protein HypA/HybF
VHELSLAEGIRELIEEAAQREGFSRVSGVWLEIGRLSAVETEAMRFCFDAAMHGSVAAGARLEIVEVPGRGHCPACDRDTALAAVYDPCEHCGALPVVVTGGTEMRVKELEVL